MSGLLREFLDGNGYSYRKLFSIGLFVVRDLSFCRGGTGAVVCGLPPPTYIYFVPVRA